jgi:hypothetical protein
MMTKTEPKKQVEKYKKIFFLQFLLNVQQKKLILKKLKQCYVNNHEVKRNEIYTNI